MTHKLLPPLLAEAASGVNFSIPSHLKARIKAFRVPIQYAFDQILGYQGNAEQFKIYGMAGDNLPEGCKMWGQGVWVEHVRGGGLYVVIEHPSFPEHELGSGIIPEIEFKIGERTVKSEFKKVIESETNPSLTIPTVQLGKERPLNLGAKMLLARSKAKGLNI